MPDDLRPVRDLLLDPERLVRAVAGGSRRGAEVAWRRAEVRYVDLKAGRVLQVVRYDATQAHTSNHVLGEEAAAVVESLLTTGFGHWHVTGTDTEVQARYSKKGRPLVSVRRRDGAGEVARGHDRDKTRLVDEGSPLLRVLGIADAQGRIKPTRRHKFKQVEEFVRLLDATVGEALASGALRTPTPQDPLRVVDLGCGNAYLTFAALAHLTERLGLPVAMTGVDVKEQSRAHNTAVAAEMEVAAQFVVGTIGDVVLDPAPEVVLALHACDTATDEALARAVGWNASVVLAAPCCHHDIAAQLRGTQTPEPFGPLTRDGIVRERFADTLTDALRAGLLRARGYRVDVVEFVGSQHTPRNTLLRAVRTGVSGEQAATVTAALAAQFGLEPALGRLLGA